MMHNEAEFHPIARASVGYRLFGRTEHPNHTGGLAYLTNKAVIDRVGAAALLVFFAPFFLVAMVLIAIFDGHPTIFRHERVGKGNRRIKVMKFRTMATNADALLADLLAKDASAREEWDRTHKLRNDPRISPIGRFLRKTSLDELPQLINVLRGDMSLVGPRPVVEEELAFYGAHAKEYLAMKPGITGLWQVSGRSSTTYDERVALDVEYYRARNVLLDLKVLLRTPAVVLLQRGAC